MERNHLANEADRTCLLVRQAVCYDAAVLSPCASSAATLSLAVSDLGQRARSIRRLKAAWIGFQETGHSIHQGRHRRVQVDIDALKLDSPCRTGLLRLGV